MSLLNEVQKYIEAHPGCTSGDIADAFAGYQTGRLARSIGYMVSPRFSRALKTVQKWKC